MTASWVLPQVDVNDQSLSIRSFPKNFSQAFGSNLRSRIDSVHNTLTVIAPRRNAARGVRVSLL